MAKRIDWDSANRQARLRKWMQNHDTYSWLDEIPSEINPDIEAWAKRQVRKSVSKVREDIEDSKNQENSLEGKVSKLLAEASSNIEKSDVELCKKNMSEVLNLILRSQLTSISSESRDQVVAAISLLSELMD